MSAPREHECVDCCALPELSEILSETFDLASLDEQVSGIDYRPATPRPIDERSRSGAYGGPRSLRCATHYRAHRDARRQAESDARSRKRAGVTEAIRQEVLAEQGGRCPCGAGLGGKRRNLSADHEHDLAAEHDHDVEVACLDCLAGFLCHHCNREVVGFLARAGRRGDVSRTRGEVADALESIAAYLRNPPAARVRARHRERTAA